MAWTDLIFDIESLGVISSESVVACIGVVPFDNAEKDVPYEEFVRRGFYVKFDTLEQISKYNRRVEANTIKWWRDQSKDAQVEVLPSDKDVKLVEGLEQLSEWINSSAYNWKNSYVLSQGNAFDFPKMESLFNDAGVKLPYNTWMNRDLRSINDILTGTRNGTYKIPNPQGFVYHNALHDAAFQAFKLQHLIANA